MKEVTKMTYEEIAGLKYATLKSVKNKMGVSYPTLRKMIKEANVYGGTVKQRNQLLQPQLFILFSYFGYLTAEQIDKIKEESNY